MGYSYGSVRDQVIHIMSCDDTWFSPLRGLEVPEPLDPAQYADRQNIRAQVLRFLNDMGIKTRYQDYIFYVYEHP